ncbi:hypothetical protein BD779DRAFT_584390 [Infundibulicybe gibba]|nr:hypothetical protein BD779DRAFT_584390 [Infundibulicybe gibba]
MIKTFPRPFHNNHLHYRKMGYQRTSVRNTSYYDDDSDLSDQDVGTHPGPEGEAQYVHLGAKTNTWRWALASRGASEDSRRAHGALKQLPEMPLDILFEIFGHLHPHDILRLARTTHRLRQLLMSRSAVSVWKSAFSRVEGLPHCPSDLTEPQYANLAFEEHCHFCLAPGVKEVFWACRIRCCKKCINK